jgi:predicted acylesterase/phospholipase RssA
MNGRAKPRFAQQWEEYDLQDLGQVGDFAEPAYGEETGDVNALRARSLWLYGSVRLLADLVEVTKDPVPGLASESSLLFRASLASPVLLRSTYPDPTRRPTGLVKDIASRVHRVWVTEKDGLGAPLEPLTHLLAGSITQQFKEPTGVVTFPASGLQVHWRRPRGETSPEPVVKTLDDLKKLTGLPFGHLFCVAPPGRTPASVLGDLFGCFHRIVYLTDRLPKEIPGELFELLYRAVRRRALNIRVDGSKVHFRWTERDEGPFFSSFVASLMKRPRHETFATEPVDQEFDSRGKTRERDPWWRIERDHCRIWLDLESIKTVWQQLPDGDEKPAAFAAKMLKDRGVKDAAFRWARAVTNRCVGVALSGGGASSYTLVPLLKRLDTLKVPIDVLSGVSGGAFLGAYYCKEGVEGLDRCVSDGWFYQVGLLPDAVTSEVGRWIIDWSLRRARMGDTERRFVPITIKLSANQPPCAHRVVSGTLGEAVQASGAAPLLFAPVTKRDKRGWSRYSDGGMAMLIPARILRNHGADIIFAFNCLSGPTQSNPLARLPGGRLLYHLTPAGGVVDLWMSAAYMQERLSRAVSPDVAAYYEAKPEDAPSLKNFFFAAAKEIVRHADRDPDLRRQAKECSDKWKAFSAHHTLTFPPQRAGRKRGK